MHATGCWIAHVRHDGSKVVALTHSLCTDHSPCMPRLACIPDMHTPHIYLTYLYCTSHTNLTHHLTYLCHTYLYLTYTYLTYTYLTYLPHIPTSHAYLTLQTCLAHALTSSHNHVLTLYPTHLSISHPLHAPGAGIHTCACTAEWQPCSKCSSARGTSRYFPEQRVSEARVMESEARL